MKPRVFLVLFFGLMLLAAARAAVAQTPGPQSPDAGQAALGTAFTYQGLLRQGGNPVNTTCDFQFSLYNAFAVGTRVGSTQTRSAIGVTDGRFVVQLSFGEGAFNGEARWLQIAVRCPAGSGTYTTLSPRQELTPAPHALALPGLWTRQNIISTNIIGGYHGNGVTAGVAGATIAGGGRLGATNRVTDDFGTVGGGSNNQAGDGVGTTAAKGHATVS
ncbi:MAG: hypothetical protein IT330_11995, partial [Anaerolineae bacterium]|nr:hypothetical protein [Anaerolineae bacterium]